MRQVRPAYEWMRFQCGEIETRSVRTAEGFTINTTFFRLKGWGATASKARKMAAMNGSA